MLFKMTITQTKTDGTQNRIEIENGESIQDQSALFDFLRPIVTDDIIEFPNFDFDFDEPFISEEENIGALPAEEAKTEAKQGEPKPPVINRPKVETPEKTAAREYSDRETGIVQIHCPSCGIETAKHAEVRKKYIYCPSIKCNEKLFLFALNDVIGEPNEMGVSFKANQIFKTAKEKWEEKHGK